MSSKNLVMIGISRRGKNRITLHGNKWKVVSEHRTVKFSDLEGWTLLRSIKTGALAWVNDWHDKDWVEHEK